MDANTSNIVLTHTGSALATVGLIQVLKQFKWVQQAQKLITRTFSVIGAFAVHIGITMTWTPAPQGGWNIAAFVPSFSLMLVAAYHIALQFFYNEGAYQGLQMVQSVQKIARSLPPPPAAK